MFYIFFHYKEVVKMEQFKENLKRALKDKKMKQETLAKILNTTQQNISLYIRGKRNPDITTIRKICIALEITPNDLFDFHDFDLDKIRQENKKANGKYNKSFTISGGNVEIKQK